MALLTSGRPSWKPSSEAVPLLAQATGTRLGAPVGIGCWNIRPDVGAAAAAAAGAAAAAAAAGAAAAAAAGVYMRIASRLRLVVQREERRQVLQALHLSMQGYALADAETLVPS